VTYGDSNSFDRSYSGLNFLVFSPELPTENLKHGIILHCSHFGATPPGCCSIVNRHGLKNPIYVGRNQVLEYVKSAAWKERQVVFSLSLTHRLNPIYR
jgi:hypothetical protein